MKKTRFISVMALLLAALMLFSACSVNYSTANTAKYVSLAEKDYTALKVDINREKVKDADVMYYINDLIYREHKTVNTTVGKDGKDQPGVFADNDVITYRVYLYDKSGKLVEHDFALASKSDTTSDSLTLNTYPTLPLGYGLNEGLAKEIESKLLSSGTLFELHSTADHNIGQSGASGLSRVPVVAYLKYNSNYTTSSANDTKGSSDTTVKPVHFEPFFDKETGKNDFNEAIYLGIKQAIEYQVKNDAEHLVTPGKDTKITINVYPTKDKNGNANSVPTDAKYDGKTAHILYDLDFMKTTTNPSYGTGKIEVTLQGAVTMRDDREDAGAFKVEFTYTAENSTVKDNNFQTAAGNTVTAANAKCTAWVYVHSRVAYNCPEYNADFILKTLKFETSAKDVVAAHKESIRKMLQDECDAEAAADAKKAIWDAACAKATLVKEPKRNIKNYVKDELAYYKYLYYDCGYKDQKTAVKPDGTGGEYYYKDFEEFVTTMFQASGVKYDSLAAVENALYAEGREIVKKNLLAYYLADALNVRYTDEQLETMLKEKGTAWAADVIKEMRRTLNDEKGASTADAEIQNIAAQLLSSFYDSTAKKYVISAAEVTDDFITWEYYRDFYGEDALYGAYHVDAVAEKLYQINAKNINYKDTDYTAS